MNTRYFCAICNTKPDQISHHKSHLQTQKHRDNRELYSKELKYFSIYKLIHPNDWLEHDEIKQLIREEFGKELTIENRHNILIQKLDVIDKYCNFEPNKVFCEIVNGKSTNVFVEPSIIYKKDNGLDKCSDRTAYLEWCIERVLQSKETIKDIHKMTCQPNIRDTRRAHREQRMQLARCTSTNYEILNDIRMKKLDIDYLTPDGYKVNFNTCIEKPEVLNDNIVQYACVLFNAFGMPSYFNNEFIYFYKEVEIETIINMVNIEGYEKKTKMNKKVWVKTSNLNDDEDGFYPDFTYVEDEVIRQKFRDYLVKFFTERKEAFSEVIDAEYKPNPTIIPRDEEDFKIIETLKNRWYKYQANLKADFQEIEKDTEIVSKLLLDSDVFKNVMKLCEFFFEYKEEVIDQYFCNGCDFEESELDDNIYLGVNV